MSSQAWTPSAKLRFVLPLVMMLVGGMLTLASGPASASDATGPTPDHLSRHASAFSVLAARWWQWGLEQPASKNPLTDVTGRFCAQGQHGHIWFLAGNFNGTPTSPITRSCTIPRGTDLFFPLVNTFSGYEIGVDAADLNSVPAQRAVVAAANLHDATGLAVSVDGHRTSFRFEKSIPFTVVFPPDDNVFGLTANLILRPTVDAGYYAFVPCLRPGKHTIVFGGAAPGQPAISVTYHLVVS